MTHSLRTGMLACLVIAARESRPPYELLPIAPLAGQIDTFEAGPPLSPSTVR